MTIRSQSIEKALADGFGALRQSEFAAAASIALRLRRESPDDPQVAALAGLAAYRQGRAVDAIPDLERAVAWAPDDHALRSALAFSQIALGRLDLARRAAAQVDAMPFWRITAWIDQREGRRDAAIAGFRRVLAAFPSDAESWNNLGLLLDHEEPANAETAFRRAIDLQPTFADALGNLARLIAGTGRDIERRDLLREAARLAPGDVRILVQLGLAEGAVNAFAAAETAFRAAIAAAPDDPSPYLEYGMLLEKLNRLDELDALVAAARERTPASPRRDFLEATARKRRGDFAAALALAQGAGNEINASRRAALVGEIEDRLGNPDAAFAAFTAMNAAISALPAAEQARARAFPREVAATVARLTPAAVSAWSTVTPASVPPAPTFLVGFPRSGTTLLDTLLLNVPDVHVLEEEPLIELLEEALGDPDRIATLANDEADALRARYFALLAARAPAPPGSRIVDKFPLNLARAALIHRVFPDARFIFAERHPCDVVLSCFIARFQVNAATVHFHSLEDAARLYDLCLEAWTRAERLLPLNVHRLRYEAMVAAPAETLRPLIGFLELPWSEGILDNRGSAARRAHIATASYAQVTEPLYTRAVGRWEMYRRHLAPVLPILEPWARRMGYEI